MKPLPKLLDICRIGLNSGYRCCGGCVFGAFVFATPGRHLPQVGISFRFPLSPFVLGLGGFQLVASREQYAVGLEHFIQSSPERHVFRALPLFEPQDGGAVDVQLASKLGLAEISRS
jgi:hypothetical protein